MVPNPKTLIVKLFKIIPILFFCLFCKTFISKISLPYESFYHNSDSMLFCDWYDEIQQCIPWIVNSMAEAFSEAAFLINQCYHYRVMFVVASYHYTNIITILYFIPLRKRIELLVGT